MVMHESYLLVSSSLFPTISCGFTPVFDTRDPKYLLGKKYLMACVSSILQSNGTMDTRSKPTFVLLRHPILFDNMLRCPFHMLSMLVCPRLALFVCMFFAYSRCLLFSLSLLVYWLVSLSIACTHMERWRLGKRRDLFSTSKKGKDASKRRQD